jgi:glycosyltransferase involved in cell wall biosynthesis
MRARVYPAASHTSRPASSDKPVPVVVIIGSLDVGGVEMDLLRNLPRIDRRRFDVSVYTFRYPGALAEKMMAAGIPVYTPAPGAGMTVSRVVSDSGRRPARRHARQTVKEPGATRKLARAAYAMVAGTISSVRAYADVIIPMARYIRYRRAKVVHCFLPDAYFYGTLATFLAGKRCVAMSRVGLNVYQDKYPFYKLVERRLLHRLVQVAVGNAKFVLAQLREEKVRERKLFLLYNGIDFTAIATEQGTRTDARKLLDIPDDAFVITIVANFHPYKGHADLIAALALVAEALPMPWVLLAAGSDRSGHLAAMKKLATERGLESRISFLGPRDDVPKLLASADLHVLPSHQEALPNNIIEAMAVGLPVVATSVGGVPELIVEGESGLLVAPNDPPALAEAILTLARDPELRRRMSEKNKAVVRERFTLEKSVASYEEVYRNVAYPRRNRAAESPMNNLPRSGKWND